MVFITCVFFFLFAELLNLKIVCEWIYGLEDISELYFYLNATYFGHLSWMLSEKVIFIIGMNWF